VRNIKSPLKVENHKAFVMLHGKHGNQPYPSDPSQLSTSITLGTITPPVILSICNLGTADSVTICMFIYAVLRKK
jgi:hypothetical protein